MKKIILILLAILSIYLVYNKVNADTIVIPDSAIRLRVIPNSNSVYDQSMKEIVKNYLESDVYTLLEETKDIKEAREKIKGSLSKIEKNIDNIFVSNNYDKTFNVNFGYNYFPSKEYKGITYEEGYYESLVVSIGEAKGDNWWCVLFPPLCMLESENISKTEYKFFAIELIKKVFE